MKNTVGKSHFDVQVVQVHKDPTNQVVVFKLMSVHVREDVPTF